MSRKWHPTYSQFKSLVENMQSRYFEKEILWNCVLQNGADLHVCVNEGQN